MPHFGHFPARRDDLRMHRTGVDDRRPRPTANVHLGDEGERLVRRGLDERLDSLALGPHVLVRAQVVELLCRGRARPARRRPDRSKPVGLLWRSVFERVLPGLSEEDVDNDALGGCEQHLLDQFLVFVMATVAADELHSQPRQRDVEDPRVGRVREVEAHDLAALDLERELRSRRR